MRGSDGLRSELKEGMGGELLDRRPRKPLKNFRWDAEKLSRTGRGESRRGWRWEAELFFIRC